MGFLDKLVLPVSGEHLHLLNLLLLIATLMFTVYTGILFGSVFISTWYRRKGIKGDNPFAFRFARDMMGIMTSNPTTWFGFGLFPLLAIAFILIQLTHGNDVSTSGMLISSILVYSFGLLAAYFYKHSFLFSDLFSAFSEGRNKREDFRTKNAEEYNHSMEVVNETTAFWSMALILVSIWIFTGALHAAKNPEFFGKSAISVLFSWGAMLKTINFLFASIAMGAATFLYVRFIWDGGYKYDDDNYVSKAKKAAAGFGVIGLIIQPIFFGLGVVFNDSVAYSTLSFSSAALAIVLAFIAAHQIYSVIRLNDVSFVKYGYWILVIGFSAYVASEHFGFTASNEKNRLVMAHHFEELEEARAHANTPPPPVDAANIFKTRCSACHKFDEKQVTAPAYADVVPKYNGEVSELADFIQNPSARNPVEYPQGMANQGLSKREAEAMAEWIMQELENTK
jgi:cytochrome c551/c552